MLCAEVGRTADFALRGFDHCVSLTRRAIGFKPVGALTPDNVKSLISTFVSSALSDGVIRGAVGVGQGVARGDEDAGLRRLGAGSGVEGDDGSPVGNDALKLRA